MQRSGDIFSFIIKKFLGRGLVKCSFAKMDIALDFVWFVYLCHQLGSNLIAQLSLLAVP